MPLLCWLLYDGRGGRIAGADVEFVSQPRSGAQPFWVGLFYTVNAIAGILVSLALASAPIAAATGGG